MFRRLALPCLIAVVALAGCKGDPMSGRPATPTDAKSGANTKADQLAEADALIERGEARKRQGMNMGNGMYHHAGPTQVDVIRDGEDLIQRGQRMRSAAEKM